MRNTRLAGHTLLREGRAYHVDGCRECLPSSYRDLDYGGYQAQGWGGHARCSCGDASPCLDSNSERKRWHAQHKDDVRRMGR